MKKNKKQSNDLSSFSRKYRRKVKKNKKNKPLASISLEQHRLFKKIWGFMVICVSLMLSVFSVLGVIDMLSMVRDENVVNICIENRKHISKVLYESKVIKNPEFFDFYLDVFGQRENIVCGTFRIKTNLDYSAIVSYLSKNSNRLDSDIVEITIPEGKNVIEIAKILEKNNVCKEEEFLKYCKTGDFSKEGTLSSLKNYEKLEYKPEGYLFPDTYKLYKNLDPKFVVKKLISNYKNKVTYKGENDEILSIEETAKKKNIELQDLINIASLIQAEAANEKDMYNVSSVIYNRLNSQNKKNLETGLEFLNIDATIWYPYRNKDKVPEKILNKFESLYDTYKQKGLPIGAICNPGIKAIDAALNPNKTLYYYYCHSKDGKAYYAKTLAEHNVNLKKAGLA